MLVLHLKEHRTENSGNSSFSADHCRKDFSGESRFLVWKVPSLPLPIKLIVVRGFDQQPATRKLTTEVGRQEPERVRSAGWLEGPFGKWGKWLA